MLGFPVAIAQVKAQFDVAGNGRCEALHAHLDGAA
jgi:hypothetical protein